MKTKMKTLPSNNLLMKNYCLTEKQLLNIMHACITYFLSEEELWEFIYEYYQKLEMRYNRGQQGCLKRYKKNLLLLHSGGKSL